MSEVNALMRQANKLTKKSKYIDAITVYEKILSLDPNNYEATFHLGNIAKKLKLYDLALKMFQATLTLKPDSPEVANNLGLVLHKLERDEEAIEIYQMVLSQHPDSSKTWVNLGLSVSQMGDKEKARIFYNEALSHNPKNEKAIANLAEIEMEDGNYQASLDLIQEALKLNKRNSQLLYNEACAQLTLGNLEKGWPGLKNRNKIKYKHNLRPWHGQNLTNKRVLLSADQGVGDQLMFAGCIQDVINIAMEVIIEVEKRLVPLFKRTFPDATVRSYISEEQGGLTSFRYDWDVNRMQFQIPFLSLYEYLKPTVDMIKFCPQKFIANPKLVDEFDKRVSNEGGNINIGVAWRGKINSKLRQRHYPEVEHFKALFILQKDYPNIRFFNLMYDECEEDVDFFKNEFGVELIAYDDIDYKGDLEKVAGLTKNMDFVVSVVSMPGVLSSSLGVNSYFLGNGKPWASLGGEDIAFLGHSKYFCTDKKEDWKKTISEMVAVLKNDIVEMEAQ